jgi:hypothetical protein
VSEADLEHPPARSRAALLADRWAGWSLPGLPTHEAGAVLRFAGGLFSPPGAVPLSRYLDPATGEYAHGLADPGRPRFLHDRTLGVVQRFAVPGTLRLVAQDGRFRMTEDEGDLGGAAEDLGFVEQAPLVLMDGLEVRRVPGTGQDVLCAGEDDPLRGVTELVSPVGWIEALPLRPRGVLAAKRVEWAHVALHRVVDVRGRRHFHFAGHEPPPEAEPLGWLARRPARGLVALVRGRDGIVRTPLVDVRPPARDVMATARWIAAPVRWARPLGASPAALARERARLALSRRHRAAIAGGPHEELLGHLAAAPAADETPLFSATHPVTGDQLLTPSELEALDLGYRVDGVLGHLLAPARPPLRPAVVGPDLPWAARLGRGRRFVPGAVPR